MPKIPYKSIASVLFGLGSTLTVYQYQERHHELLQFNNALLTRNADLLRYRKYPFLQSGLLESCIRSIKTPPQASPPTLEKIQTITFSGGGAKGIFSLRQIKDIIDLINNGKIPQLKLIRGTSVGAIQGSLLAIGANKENVDSMLKHLLSSPKHVFSGFQELFQAETVEEQQQKIDEIISKNMYRNWFDSDPAAADMEQSGRLLIHAISAPIVNSLEKFADMQAQLHIIRQQIFERQKARIAIEDHKFLKNDMTLGGLHILATKYPKLFKDFAAYVVDKSNGKSILFSSENPDMAHIEISKVVAASAAHPLLYPPEIIGGRKYIDGGLANNSAVGEGPELNMVYKSPIIKQPITRWGVFISLFTRCVFGQDMVMNSLMENRLLAQPGRLVWPIQYKGNTFTIPTLATYNSSMQHRFFKPREIPSINSDNSNNSKAPTPK